MARRAREQRAETPREEPARPPGLVAGLVVRQTLVVLGSEPARGTFAMEGARTEWGAVDSGALVVPLMPGWDASRPFVFEGSETLRTATGELIIELRAVARVVPGTTVLAGGGTWHVISTSGDLDGLRAAGSLTLTASLDPAGAATFELILTGRVPGARTAGEGRVSGA